MADFGRDYVEKKRRGAQNARRLSASSIARAHAFSVSNFVMEATVAELKMRAEDVQKRFKEFDAEHKFMMSFIPIDDKKQLDEQDAYYASIENKCMAARAAFVTRIDEKEKAINRQIAEIEESNKRRFGTIEQKRQNSKNETSQLEPIPSTSRGGGQPRPSPLDLLNEEYRQLGLDSDSDDERDDGPASDDERKLKRNDDDDGNEQLRREMPNQKSDVQNVSLRAKMGPRTPESAVKVVNPLANEDLRMKLKRSRNQTGDSDNGPDICPVPSKRRPKLSCFNCHEAHPLYRCTELMGIPLEARIARVKALNLCENCFSPLVNIRNNAHICRAGICRRCRAGYHNSILCPAVHGN